MTCKQCDKHFVPNNSNKARKVQQFCSHHCAQLNQWRNNPKGDRRSQERARSRIKNMIRDGRLKRQPCEVCGGFADAHHDDYNQPMEVRWLCRKHHFKLHQKEKLTNSENSGQNLT